MDKRSFTIMEILIAVVIVGILASIGVPMYQNLVEESRARVCEENLKALKVALDIYAMENDTMPAALTELPEKIVQKAYAQVLKQRDKRSEWKFALAHTLDGFQQQGLAYAGFMLDNLAKGNLKMLSCPKDPSSPILTGGNSYGINNALAGISSQAYKGLAVNTLLIGDCENINFAGAGNLAGTRHSRIVGISNHTFGLAITRDGALVVIMHGAVQPPNTTYYNMVHPWGGSSHGTQ